MKVIATVVGVVCVAAVTVAAQQEPKTAMPPGVVLGPTVGHLGQLAQVSVPDGYLFLEAGPTRRFLEEGQNIPSGHELGTVIYRRPDDTHWFAVFAYAESGHVDDGDRNDIDADAIMSNMKASTDEDNAERKKRGWPSLTIGGWNKKPYYEVKTNNLTWSTRVMSANELSVNHSVRLLGRTGVMSVQLVAEAETLDKSVAEFNALLGGFSYVPGQKYAEFRKGDKLAGYGLAALIGAGAAGVAIKSGLLQKLWKVIVLGFIAVVGALRKFFSGLFGRKPTPTGQPTGAR
jgi:uncharacterized membrane-anchored protein